MPEKIECVERAASRGGRDDGGRRKPDSMLKGVSILISEAIEATRLSKDLAKARKMIAAHRRKRSQPRKKK